MIHARGDYNSRIQDSSGLIPADEPVFLLRGCDLAAPAAIRAWVAEAGALGADPDMLQAALGHADAMEQWQIVAGSKVPDMPKAWDPQGGPLPTVGDMRAARQHHHRLEQRRNVPRRGNKPA